VQVAFVVPKRLFKKSSQRNRIKRLLREAYRLNKLPLIEFLQQQQQAAHLIFIYTHKEELTQQETSAKIVLTLQKLINQFSDVERTSKT
jgi:ribonuclease P protein component